METYDLVVIGTGPAGEKAAAKAAYFKYKVAIVEKSSEVGGTAVHEAVASKVLKEIALHLSGKVDKELLGQQLAKKSQLFDSFMPRARALIKEEAEEVRQNLANHGITLYQGQAFFSDPHVVGIEKEERSLEFIYGKYILIATGSSPGYKFSSGDVDGIRIHNVKTILDIKRLPKSLCIVGMGIGGCEYGSIFSLMGAKVYFVNHSKEILGGFDQEIAKFFVEELQKNRVEILLECTLKSIVVPASEQEPLLITFSSGKTLAVDMLLYAYGRNGNTQVLQLDKAGVKVAKNETIIVDQHYRSNVEHIYAAGDVNGQIRLSNIAMDQGRLAVTHMFRTDDLKDLSSVIPFGVYSIPELAAVGMTEEMMQSQQLDYAVGAAYYSDTARGKFLGAEGFIKLLFTKNDHIIRGIHIVGSFATEIIHYGVHIVREQKDLLFLIQEPFNYPTLHEIYKYAAYDGLSNLTGYKLKKHRRKLASEEKM